MSREDVVQGRGSVQGKCSPEVRWCPLGEAMSRGDVVRLRGRVQHRGSANSWLQDEVNTRFSLVTRISDGQLSMQSIADRHS